MMGGQGSSSMMFNDSPLLRLNISKNPPTYTNPCLNIGSLNQQRTFKDSLW